MDCLQLSIGVHSHSLLAWLTEKLLKSFKMNLENIAMKSELVREKNIDELKWSFVI